MSCWKYVDLGRKKSFLYVDLCRFGIAVFLRVVLWQQACCSVAEMFEFNAVKYITEAKKKTISPDEIEKIHQKCIDQDGKCKLCHKGCYDTPSDTHKKSKGHLQMVHEQVDRLFGESKLCRTASEGCRCKSQRAMRDYWEHSVENFGHLARRLVYEENRVIFFKYGSPTQQRPIPSPRIRSLSFTWALCQNMHVGVSGECDMPEVPEDHGTWWPVHRVPSTGYSIVGSDD